MLNLKSFFKRADNHNVFVSTYFYGCLLTLFYCSPFLKQKSRKNIDYIYTSCFIVTIIIPVLINLYILVPRFLVKEKYLLFGSLFLFNLLIFTQVNKWFFGSFIDVLFPEYYFVSYHSNTTLFFIFSLFLIGTTLLKLSEDWFRLDKAKNEVLLLEKMEIQNQLASLKSQINPHFLFNSLNVLYALSLDKKEETSSAILDLSDILRYVLYEKAGKEIPLEKEIELIQKYLVFQKYRYQEDSFVEFKIDVDDDAFEIHPMLLLPLVENSFKHGIKGEIKDTFVHIHLSKKNNEFCFYIENNISEGEIISDEEYSGLGLENIRQNLKLIYPNSHSFEIEETEKLFAN